jgi:hypothetical protein
VEASILIFPAIDGLKSWLTGVMLLASHALLMSLLAWAVAVVLRRGPVFSLAPRRARAEPEPT